MKTKMENPTTDSWEGIVTNYLKAENLEGKSGSFVCEDIKVKVITDEDGNKQPKLEIETLIDDVKYIYVPNWTNVKFIKKQISAPKDLIGKKLSYEKARVRNPQSNEMVDSIVIVKVE